MVSHSESYINVLVNVGYLSRIMALLHLILLLSVIYMSKCHKPDDCSKKGLFSGFAKNRDTMPTATVTLIVYADVQTACDAGARCAVVCFNDSTEWNFIEVRRVRMFRL